MNLSFMANWKALRVCFTTGCCSSSIIVFSTSV